MSRVPSNPVKGRAFLDCIANMEQTGVITPVPPSETFCGFYSNLFLVPKKDGSFRPVLDLKFLNKHIRSVRFKMETLRSVIRGMEPGQLLMSLDIKDAYLHVPIWPPHHRFLRFAFRNRHYQFVALPFGLSSAPRVFNRLPTVHLAMKVLGLMVSSIEAVPFAQIHLRPLQANVLSGWKGGPLSQRIVLQQTTRESLLWWLNHRNLSTGQSWATPDWTVITTDASLLGWGATWNTSSVQGRWSPAEKRLHIIVLELRAVRLALRHWSPLLQDKSIRVQSDNSTTVAYINRQGGTRSKASLAEVVQILAWAELSSVRLSAIHIPGVDNTQADFLSRNQLDPGEWELHPAVFTDLVKRWGSPQVDLMASRANRKVPAFYARFRDPSAMGVDAMTQVWDFHLAYVFPPFPMLPRVLKKIKQSYTTVIVIAPYWPRRTWFTDLQDMSIAQPVSFPPRYDLLQQGPILHHNPGLFALTGWLLRRPSGDGRV
ncbi:uncharacterized protein LOC121398305 [Xenopus laevis]|uniref:ribonuclease H n=1 Tax=Xenopus laevis TaxID=8355 RepID=A0A8J1LVD3_XENLA|nr:uncharacterized protein LOC121398305 [Xenopus laevis]